MMKKEYVIINGVDHTGEDTFMCLSGERIDTETDTHIYPFEHAVTLRLSAHSAARIGQEIITVSEAALLQDCELPKATSEASNESHYRGTTSEELPAVERHTATKGKPPKQLTLFGTHTAAQLTLFD